MTATVSTFLFPHSLSIYPVPGHYTTIYPSHQVRNNFPKASSPISLLLLSSITEALMLTTSFALSAVNAASFLKRVS
ncbi:hypothetical protein NX059_005035 [Plenodomus lindquistii]|nr:hypothetical protein NX059_005035 [Plenodomus lindquistii]